MKKNKVLTYFVFILITQAVGFLSGIISQGGMDRYNAEVIKPALTPPAIVFPIVWSILFLLMAIGASRVYLSDSAFKTVGLSVYALQLAVNFFWSIIFFNLQSFGFAFFWLILLWILIITMIWAFSKSDKLAAFLQIPYLLWVSFAGYLNLMTWLLNR